MGGEVKEAADGVGTRSPGTQGPAGLLASVLEQTFQSFRPRGWREVGRYPKDWGQVLAVPHF